MRAQRVADLPPTERLALVAKEVNEWREAKQTAGRGTGSAGATATVGVGADDVTSGGGAGYAAVHLIPLRRMLCSDGFTLADRLITDAMDRRDYNEAIASVFCSGFLPLLHALIGRLRSLT